MKKVKINNTNLFTNIGGKTITSIQIKPSHEIRMITLGFIGCILVLNIVDDACATTGYDKDQIKDEAQLKKLAPNNTNSHGVKNIIDCIRLFRKPNVVMLFVPTGAQVDLVIKGLLRQFQLNNLSQAEVQDCLTRNNPKRNSKIVEPNFL